MTVVTMLALAVIALMIKDISKTPTVARPAALSATVRPTTHPTHTVSPRPKPSPSASGKSSKRKREIADASSGLSYRLLSSPWRRGCPETLNTPTFSWSAGEHAVAGSVSGTD